MKTTRILNLILLRQKLSLLIFLVLATQLVFSQPYLDLLKVEYDHGFTTDFEEVPGRSTFNEWVVDALIPIVLTNNTTLMTGFNLERIHISPYPSELLTVYGTMLKLGINRKFSDSWNLTLLALPKFSSDLQIVGRKDIQTGIYALLKKELSSVKNFRFGVYANTDLFGTMVVPIFGFYHATTKWEFNLMLPISGDINYQMTPALKTGIRFNGFIKSYNLNGHQDDYLVKANNEIGPYFQANKGSFVWQITGGLAIGRSIRTYGQNDRMDLAISALKIGDDRVQRNVDFQDGCFLKTAILYRFALN